jgi:hypothetical protein
VNGASEEAGLNKVYLSLENLKEGQIDVEVLVLAVEHFISFLWYSLEPLVAESPHSYAAT